MDEVIKKLTAEQALEIVKRLSEKGGEIREAVLAEAKSLLMGVDVDETADEVFCVLDSIDVQDCWDRSGSPATVTPSLVKRRSNSWRKNFNRFTIKPRPYRELGMAEQETTYCMGVILGIYRYEHESK